MQLVEKVNTWIVTPKGLVLRAFISTSAIPDGRFETQAFPSTRSISGQDVPDYGRSVYYDFTTSTSDAVNMHSRAVSLLKDRSYNS